MIKKAASISFLIICFCAFISRAADFSPIGQWRAVFHLKPGVEVPINFEIKQQMKGLSHVYFRNADERFDGGTVEVVGDSVFLHLDQFDNEIAFKVQGDSLVGVLRKQDKTNAGLPVTAVKGKTFRFTETKVVPARDATGTYDINFSGEKDEKAVGLFKQEGSKLTGTFLRITGDSRYLEGIVIGNEFYLSSFIGSTPSYYKGVFNADGTLSGEIVGARGSQLFTGKLNDEAALPDPYKLTFLKEGYSSLAFSFPDVDGKKVSLSDTKFKNKVVLIAITGTWCPNCVDETSFLAPWYKQNKKRGVEIIALHYERKTDTAFVRKVLTRFKNKYDIQYDQLIAGTPDKQQVATSLPALNSFLAFPTTIVIDRQGKVANIHTGYSGPATGKYYEEFKKEFEEEMSELLK